jgi:hypothetical protein
MKGFCLGYLRHAALLEVAVLGTLAAAAQTADGNAGINQANTMIRSYFDSAVNLMYGIAAIVALIGAVDVFMKMHRGQEVGRSIAIWFGGCIFLAVVATVIKSFFGM